MSMDAETLAALRGSIEKWERIVAGTDADLGTGNCPLCELFFDNDEEGECYGCPVAVSVGRSGCNGTPYEKMWRKVAFIGDFADTLQRIVAADAELDFLRSLLPEGEK